MSTIPDIAALIDEHLRAKREAEGPRAVAGGMTWRASTLGRCLRRNYLEHYLRTPALTEPDGLSLRRFEIGNMWAGQFGLWFYEMGLNPVREWSLVDEALDVGGHVDLFLTNGHRFTLGIELKSVQSKWFWYRTKERESTASDEYMIQTATYDLINRKLSEAIPFGVLSVSKDDLTMAFDLVEQRHRDEALRRLTVLNEAKRTNTPPPCTCTDGWEWKYCGWYSGDQTKARAKGAKPEGECCVVPALP